MDALLGCLTKFMIRCKAHCKCNTCCESDCMVEEGKLSRVDSKTSLKENKEKIK